MTVGIKWCYCCLRVFKDFVAVISHVTFFCITFACQYDNNYKLIRLAKFYAVTNKASEDRPPPNFLGDITGEPCLNLPEPS